MKKDPRIWMWAEACEQLERAERMHRQFFQPQPRARRPAWEPPADLYETPDAYWVVIALPGVPPEQVEIVVEGGVLTVAAERALPAASRAALIHRIEIPHGRFERHVELPPGPLAIGGREMIDGCLVIQLVKR